MSRLHTSKRIQRYPPPFVNCLQWSPHSRIKAVKHIFNNLHGCRLNEYLAVNFEIDIMVFVKRELLTIEAGVGRGQEDKIIEEKTDQFLLRFCLLQRPRVEKLPRADRVCQ